MFEDSCVGVGSGKYMLNELFMTLVTRERSRSPSPHIMCSRIVVLRDRGEFEY